ncbi:MAG: YdcF family protein [Alphaproteobacteria bacterium]|nr:YdcF family protein [Alphaproteobacteria bacterium]
MLFVDRIPRVTTDGDNGPPSSIQTDAIVVLTGGRGRVERGTELLARSAARSMLISGVGANVSARDLIPPQKLKPATLDCCVTLGRAARNTRENAVETAGWVAANGVTSLRLVTADFHMPRSLLEFHARLPDVKVLPDSVKSENVRLTRWWLWPGTAFLLVGEYNKYLAASARGFVTRMLDRR